MLQVSTYFTTSRPMHRDRFSHRPMLVPAVGLAARLRFAFRFSRFLDG